MKKQNMSQSKVHSWLLYLFIGSFLLSGVTFSKYITSTTAEDNARVSKFGELILSEPNKPEKYTLIPGVPITKSPQISFSENELSAYVFVTITADDWMFSAAFSRYIYSMDDKFSWEVDGSEWTFLEYDSSAKQTVFYQKVPAGESLDDVAIIKNNTITVSDTLKNSEMAEYESSMNISFKAYAIQSSGFESVETAWAAVKNKE